MKMFDDFNVNFVKMFDDFNVNFVKMFLTVPQVSESQINFKVNLFLLLNYSDTLVSEDQSDILGHKEEY